MEARDRRPVIPEPPMTLENFIIPLALNPADIDMIVRQAKDARAEAIRVALLQLPLRLKALAARFQPAHARPAQAGALASSRR